MQKKLIYTLLVGLGFAFHATAAEVEIVKEHGADTAQEISEAETPDGVKESSLLEKYSPISESELRNVINAYYFYQGKLALGDMGAQRFPDSASRIEEAQKKLENSMYGKGGDAIEKLYHEAFSEETIEREDESAREKFRADKEKYDQMSPDQIVRALDPKRLCTRNQKKLCDTLVIFNEEFRENPLLLIQNGFRGKLDTAHNTRAQGLRTTLEYPSLWTVVPGKRARDVYRIEGPSQDNTMPHMILSISEPSRDHMYFTDGGFYGDVEKWLNENGTMEKMTKKRINGCPVAITEETVFYDRDGIPFSGRSESIWMLYQDQLIRLQCAVLGQKVHQQHIEEVFDRHRPLYDYVIDSLVFHRPAD